MGDQVLVVGGASGWDQVATGNLRDGRVLNATGTAWQSIPDAPVALTSGLPSAWTGTDLFLIAATGELLSFTPSSKMWATLPRMRGNPDIGTAMAWIGSELYAMDYLGQTFAYSPTQKTWRVLESPTTLHADHPALKSVVRGSNWILGGGSTLAIFDTKASAWLPVPTIPSDSMVLVIGQDVLLTTVDFHNPAPTSRLNGANQFVPTGDTVDFLWGGNSATFLWVVDGHWVGDSGPAMTNGRNLQYRSADTWISTGMPTTSLVDVPVQTASGHLVTTDGVKASRLKPLPKG